MAFHRASRRQLQYIADLAKETDANLPWGWEGYSSTKAAKLIDQLRRKLYGVSTADKDATESADAPQTSLFD